MGAVGEGPTPFSTPFFPRYPRQIIDNGTPGMTVASLDRTFLYGTSLAYRALVHR